MQNTDYEEWIDICNISTKTNDNSNIHVIAFDTLDLLMQRTMMLLI